MLTNTMINTTAKQTILKNYDVGELLGKGITGECRLVTHSITKETRVLKTINLT